MRPQGIHVLGKIHTSFKAEGGKPSMLKKIKKNVKIAFNRELIVRKS